MYCRLKRLNKDFISLFFWSCLLFCLSGQGMARWRYAAFTNTGKPTVFLFLTFPVLRDKLMRQVQRVKCLLFHTTPPLWKYVQATETWQSLTITTRGLSIGNQVYEASQMWLFLLISAEWFPSTTASLTVGPKKTVYSTRSTLWSCQNVDSCMQCAHRSNFHHPVLMHSLDYRIWKEWWKCQNWGGKYYLIFLKNFTLARGGCWHKLGDGNTIAE